MTVGSDGCAFAWSSIAPELSISEVPPWARTSRSFGLLTLIRFSDFLFPSEHGGGPAGQTDPVREMGEPCTILVAHFMGMTRGSDSQSRDNSRGTFV